MNLIIQNHTFQYEIEKLVRVFYPHTKITVTREANGDPDLILRYKGFNETLFGWHKYECAYDSIQLRISKYPDFLIDKTDGGGVK